MLSGAIKNRTEAIAYGITPKGSVPPFTEKKSDKETLQWWMQHRYDQIGLALVSRMTPAQVAELDAWLTQAMNHPAVQAQTQGPRPAPEIPGVQGIFTRALGAERRMEGPHPGSEVS